METFSLLQQSLDQNIDRTSLEDASDAAASVARADCARLHREMHGILVSGLPREEALAFQAALKAMDFPTDLVADGRLPVLHESFQIQRISRREEILDLADSMGRSRIHPLADLVFLAAGYIKRIEFKTTWNQHLDFGGKRHEMSRGLPGYVTEREFKEETELEFRIDFFFCSSPHRVHAALGKENVIFHQDTPLRLKNDSAIQAMLTSLSPLLPAERMSTCMRDPSLAKVYPNHLSYEKEIRWHFHRIATASTS
jgi:hypothetical protein